MKNAFDNLIVIGRPACGKSEFFDFIRNKINDADRLEKLFIAPFEEVDDFVWLWEKCEEDDIWEGLGYDRIMSKRQAHAYVVTNIHLWDFLLEKINHEVTARFLSNAKFYENKTLLIEFSRGSKNAYQNAFNRISKEILKKSAIFYIKVSFEESLRRNEARYQEKLKHSILAHKVPDEEMYDYYNVDDWDHITNGKECGHLILRGLKVPFVTMNNEPESTDPAVIGPRYAATLGKLWDLM
jgi:hypothetical protein